jgi:predicted membrane-bound spermidine synthase
MANRGTYVGLFLITLATLMYELFMTRIFSVTIWYHFAFMVVSIAMFGMTVAATYVYLLPHVFTPAQTPRYLALSALAFSFSTVIGILTHLTVPFVPDPSLIGLYSGVLAFGLAAVPFFFSGIAVCLALTKFPRQVSLLYAADLVGAALGCLAAVYIFAISDGPSAVFVIAFVAALGAVFFSSDPSMAKMRRHALLASALMGIMLVGSSILTSQGGSPMRVVWAKGQADLTQPLYEKWNSFARIRVWGRADQPSPASGWGLSPTYPLDRTVRQLFMDIDSTAATVMTAYSGDPAQLEHLKYDIPNLAHYARQDARVLAIGVGGGRDVLSALAFDQRSVVGVEMNGDIIQAVTERFGAYTGHLDRNPRVKLVVAEARSYLAGSTDKFDIIQISFIDTWAATASGAYLLTEHSLYTTEAWRIFLDHLTPNGVLTVSRWYLGEKPAETYRLVALASASLMEAGVARPRDHIFLARKLNPSVETPVGVGTIVVGRAPLSQRDLRALEQAGGRLQFDTVLSPSFAQDSTFENLVSGQDLRPVIAAFPADIAPPTDDRPFFFYMVRPKSLFDGTLFSQEFTDLNRYAVPALYVLLVIVIALTGVFALRPLFAERRQRVMAALPLLAYFGAIGLGFMFIEISLLQRLIIFLGHPTYSLSVVLFSLLLASGLGSLSASRPILSPVARLILLIAVLAAGGLATPLIAREFEASTTAIRIVVAMALLFPLGLFMGMAFPLGMRLASATSGTLTPWLWGMNGAASVCGSVLAILIALNGGLAAAFWTGVACYAGALVAYICGTLLSTRVAPAEAVAP